MVPPEPAPRRKGALIAFALLSGPTLLGAVGTAGMRPDLVFHSRESTLCWVGGLAWGTLGGVIASASWFLSGKHLAGRSFARRLARVLSVVGSTLLMALPALWLLLFGPIVAMFLGFGQNTSEAESQQRRTSPRDRVLNTPPLRAPEKKNAP
ncbi:MAG TPA: hypothetical protein VH208_03195 [Myxococcaceae bacterium]|nr:hypothetical protein [Myxococcaceae bacterium]